MGDVIPLFKWYNDINKAYELARWLVKMGKLTGEDDIQAFYANPKRWNDEWVEYQEEMREAK